MSEYLNSLGVNVYSKVFIIVDPAIMSQKYFKEAIKIPVDLWFYVEFYSEVEYEPSISCAEKLVEVVREFKPNAIVGIGGGSTLDIAKIAVAAFDNQGMMVKDFIGFEKVPGRVTSFILIPITAGTGSEVSRYSVLTRGLGKVGVTSKHILPDIALVDPVLTYTMPPKITVGTGLDALSHDIEAMISTDSNIFTDLLSLQAIKWIYSYLPKAYYNGNDIEARYYMSLAATTAGIPLSIARVVLRHSISQTFGPTYKIHHGIACGITLPYIMDFYLPSIHDKLAGIFNVIHPESKSHSIRENAENAVKEIWRFIEDLEVPLSLKKLDVSKMELNNLAERILKEWPRTNSPIELTKERVLKVYEAMYDGRFQKVKKP